MKIDLFKAKMFQCQKPPCCWVAITSRFMDLEIITSKAELPIILLLRDIVQLLEDTADRAEQAADLVRILVL